jgi:hypothetical protein
MYAYSMAAAHEDLPHFTMMHYMVSNTDMDEEGWKWIDNLETDVCQPPKVTAGDNDLGISSMTFYPGKPMPTVVHFCQFFRIGELGFHKRRLQKSIFDCDFPLLVDPPLDIGKLDYKNRDGEVSNELCMYGCMHVLVIVHEET